MIDLLQHPITVTCVLLSVSFFVKQLLSKRRRSGYPLPPGPTGYPIIGNFFEIGTKITPWITYSELSKTHGELLFLESLGTRLLVLNSVRTAVELLDQRSSKYSSRPYLPMLCGEMEYDRYFSLMPYSPMWRRQRRALHQELHATVVSRYQPVIIGEVQQYIRDMTTSPDKFQHHVRHYFDRIIFRAFYGVKIQDKNDPYVRSGELTMEGFIKAGVPGTFMIDIFPALKYVPKWFPGTGWKNFAEYYKNASSESRKAPYEHCMNAVREGNAEPCMATRMIDGLPDKGGSAREEEEVIVRDALAAAYPAGADTSNSATLTFLLLMALHPDVQKRAQAELDEVAGFGQLPTFEDRPKLVYLEAMTKEIFRWQAEVPLGVAHATTEDDVYEGYFIPKGTIVAPNVWHMLKSTDNYDNPSEFNPDRFIKNGEINKDILDPYSVAFGFGRRVCPGRHLSLDTLFSLFSATLASFDISPQKDEAGNSKLKCSFDSGGVVVSPEPYECVITPRSKRSV